MESKNQCLYNKEKTESLSAGPLTLEYTDTYISRIKFNGTEVIRRIYFALRDEGWDTIPQIISNFKLQSGEDYFNICFDAVNNCGEIDFTWKGNIYGSKEGKIEYSFEGTANSTFLKNRIGLCVLFPIEGCAGKSCTIKKEDGSKEAGAFPELVSPHQPFMDIQAIDYEVCEGVQAVVSFQGDTFEMEDQRNWTDDSYKVYSTPLAKPFPVKIEKDTTVSQKVTLELKLDDGYVIEKSRPENIDITVYDEPLNKLPFIGLALPSDYERITLEEMDLVKNSNITHLRVDLSLFEDDYEARFISAADNSKKLGIPLEIAIFISDNFESEVESFVDVLDKYTPDILSVLVFHKDEKCSSYRWMAVVRKLLKDYDKELLIGSGTNMNFAELNRGEIPVKELDLICYPINPQVHGSDNETLVENLMAQSYTVAKAKKIAGNLPISVTPVTLKPRFNADLYKMAPRVKKSNDLYSIDSRQSSLFAACWTLGSIKYLSGSGVMSITYYETSGKSGRTSVFIFNLSSNMENAIIGGLPSKVDLFNLDNTNVTDAMGNPKEYRKRLGKSLTIEEGKLNLVMSPYSITRLDYQCIMEL